MVVASVVFLSTVGVVLSVGPRMARVADGLAEATRLGGALFGLIFLALATDLPEVALTPSAVISGSPGIAIGGLLGNAATQLLLIAVVDLTVCGGGLYRSVDLLGTVGQCAVMLTVLALPLLASGIGSTAPVSAGTFLLPLAFVGVLTAIRSVGRGDPLSVEEPTSHAPASGSDEVERRHDLRVLWLRFAGYAVVLAAAGVALERTSGTIGDAIGLGETAAGALLAGIPTSLPELVTAISAARQGAVDLAVGDLVGSSALDVVLLALADVFYTEGSVFELLGPAELSLLGMSVGITMLLLLGLARRELEPTRFTTSHTMWIVYGVGVTVLLVSG